MPAPRSEVKVYLTSEEREHLDREASRLLVSRGQLIRDRALGRASGIVVSRDAYAAAVANASRTVAGVPRSQLEAIVASVITALAQPAATA